MKTIMAKNPLETSFSFSRRYFNWKKKPEDVDDDSINDEEALTFDSSSHSFSSLPSSQDQIISDHTLLADDIEINAKISSHTHKNKKKKLYVTKFTSFFTKSRSSGDVHSSLGSKVVGTLFGYRRGHVHIAFQENPNSTPAFLIELSTQTSVLVREMASGLVRVALECDKKWDNNKKEFIKLLEEPLWRAYCNGKKCGYAMRRDCGPHEWHVLRSVGPITMGAGVLPAIGGGGSGADGDNDNDSDNHKVKEEGELMYMRAKFERIVGSKDSEAFYMMNPDGNGGPELSFYLLRV